jgi:hypothetical protein
MVPLPCFNVPSHTANPVRVAIVFPPLVLSLAECFAPDERKRNIKPV